MHKLISVLLLVTSTIVQGQKLSGTILEDVSSSIAVPSSSGLSSTTDNPVSEIGSRLMIASSVAQYASIKVASMGNRVFGGNYFLGQFLQKPGKHDPIGSVAATYTYVASGEIGGSNRSLNGWTITPELNFTKHLALQADFTGLYVHGINPGQTRFTMAGGPRYYFTLGSRLTPFIFAEGGEVRRIVTGNTIKDWNPVAKSGVGVDYQISRVFGLQLVPGEYIGQKNDDGSWLHSYSVRGGVVFNFYR